MNQHVLTTKSIQSNQEFDEKNIVQATIFNYGTETVYFFHNDIKLSLPPKNTNLDVPAARYKFETDNGFFNLKLKFDFGTELNALNELIKKTGNIIITYSTFNPNNCI